MSHPEILDAWGRALALTLGVEVAVAAWVFRGRSQWRVLGVATAATLLTHPILWWVWPHVVQDYTMALITGEACVLAVETAVLRYGLRLEWRRALLGSALMNGASLLVGGVL